MNIAKFHLLVPAQENVSSQLNLSILEHVISPKL